jgi:hypothetical protein
LLADFLVNSLKAIGSANHATKAPTSKNLLMVRDESLAR